MAFNTPVFVVFFVVVLMLYALMPKRYKWIWLLAAGIVFAGGTHPRLSSDPAAGHFLLHLSDDVLCDRCVLEKDQGGA